MWNLKNKINEPKKPRNRLIATENKLIVIRSEGSWGLVKKVKGLRRTNC